MATDHTRPRPPFLLLFTRLPEVGRVKTRLIPTLGPRGACTLHRALWEDTLRLAAKVVDATGCRAGVAWTGQGRAEELLHTATVPCELFRQRGRDLGERLAVAHRRLLSAGHPAVVTLGADSPLLSPAVVLRAFRVLQTVDVTVAPAADGGYVLLGASRFLPALYRNIPWGTAGVMGATQQALRSTRASVSWLPAGFDVDDAAGLARLRKALATAPADLCPSTRLALAAVGEHLARGGAR